MLLLYEIISVSAHEFIVFIKMKQSQTKIRIKDIAAMAGVSEGTVDRVLHKRGEVSEKSRIAVEKVLQEINYSPNLLARSLASKKSYRFICLIPEHSSKDYWADLEHGFDMAALEYLQYNIVLEKKYFNQFDAVTFTETCNNILSTLPDAVILAPIFRAESLWFTQKLDENQIPFSFIDSMIEEADFLTYYGQNSFQSGYVAARLLLETLPADSKVIVLRTKRKGAVSNQTIARKSGFMHYISEHNLHDLALINVEMNDKDESANLNTLQTTFENHQNIRAAITFNSKVYRLAMHLQALQYPQVRLLGYDLLEENVEYLKQNVVSFLIAQRPDKQAYLSVRDMCTELIFKQQINKINYMPIDILMKENIEDYQHFRE